MKNRIGAYWGGVMDVERASGTLLFCEVLMRIQSQSHDMAKWEFDAIYRLHIEAVQIFREQNVPLPWERIELS